MELFKLFGRIVIDNSDANKALGETSDKAKQTSDSIGKSNQSTQSSNQKTGSSWSSLKAKVNEYKAQGLNTSQAWQRASADMRNSTEGAGNGMVGTFARVGAAVGAFLTVDAIKNFGMSCVQAAADVEAANSQFSQVFGDLESKASKSLSSIANEAGVSENRMKGSFTKIAAFAKTTGMDTDEALSLSERAMIAVADSAAFYDRSLEETTESLQSFLKGNYENDAALGLSCTETTRNAAANKLYGKSFKDLSEEQKQLTLLKMVEDANKASGALGQAARESDTWTNVTGNLKQAWTDFQAVIGAKILPNAVGVVKNMVGVVESWTAKMPALIDWCKEHKTTLQVLGIAVGTVAAAIGLYNANISLAAIKTTIMTGATAAFGSVMAFLTSPITLTVAAIGALVAAFVVAYKRSDTFRNAVDGLKEKLVAGFNAMKDAASALKDKIAAAWDDISAKCAPLVSAIKENLIGAFNDLKQAGQGLKDRFDELKEKFQPIADFLSGVFSSAASGAADWFDKLTDKAGDLAQGALSWLNDKITAAREGFQQFTDFAGRLWEKLDPLVTLIRDNLLNSLQNLSGPLQTIKDAFGTVSDTVMNHLLPALRDWLMPIWESLKSALSGVAGIIGGVVVVAFGLISGVINGVVSAISGLAQAFSGIVEIAANVFGLIVGIFTLNGDKCKEALQGIWDGVCKVFGGLWDAVSGFLKGFVDGVVGFFTGLWDTLVGHSIVPDTIDGIVNCFSGLWDRVTGFISSFKEGVTNAFTNAKENAVNAFNTLKDKVSGAASTVKEKVSSAWSSMKEKTSSAFSSAKEKASSAFDSIKSKVSSAASSTKERAASAWDALKEKTSSAFSNAKSKATSAFSALKSSVTSHASATATQAGSKFNSMKSKISSAVSSAKSLATSAFSTMKSSISTHVSGALSTVQSKFNAIKDKISSVMESAKSIVSGAVEKLKSAFNFEWSLPNIKLPHFSVSGGQAPWGFGGKGSLPSVSVSWYRKAYDEAMILNDPTIFGYSGASGKMLGGGEGNGNEVVAGESHLMNLIGDAVEAKTSALNERIVALLVAILNAIMDGNGEMLRAMLADKSFKVGEREFARLVKEYA